jgi:HEAT repeat protein
VCVLLFVGFRAGCAMLRSPPSRQVTSVPVVPVMPRPKPDNLDLIRLAIDHQVERLSSPDRRERIEAARALNGLAIARLQGDDRIPRLLAGSLEDNDRECAEAAAEALRVWATRKQTPELVRALRHPSDRVRLAVCRALANCGSAASLPELTAVAREDKNPEVRSAAREAAEQVNRRR